MWVYKFLFALTLCRLIQASTYNVAVVEYAPIMTASTPQKLLELNLNNYLDIIEETSKNKEGLDLMIFPESSLMLSAVVPDIAALLPVSDDIVLCNSSDQKYGFFLKKLSCSAVQHNITIIINFTEKAPCPKDLPDNCSKWAFYNTDAALGPNGTIVGRYRKWNLFGEYGKSKPSTLDLPILKIGNTNFGIMTCFDIQFGMPAFNLTRQMGLQNIIFPLSWISELPYLTALQVQQMWAQEFNVVLLASGASKPSSGAGGSGIFVGTYGALDKDMLPQPGTKVMVQRVSTELLEQASSGNQNVLNLSGDDELAAAMDNFFLLVDPSIIDHSSVVLNPNQKHVKSTICHVKNFCCNFDISLDNVDPSFTNETYDFYTYHLVAFDGIRTYSKLYYGGVESCGLIACLNDSLESCGQRFSNYSNVIWPVVFNSISITASFKKSAQRVQFASTLDSTIRPLPLNAIAWEKEELNSSIVRKLTLKRPQSRLITFGIFGRDFERDWDPIRNKTSNNSSTPGIAVGMGPMFVLVLFLIVFPFTS